MTKVTLGNQADRSTHSRGDATMKSSSIGGLLSNPEDRLDSMQMESGAEQLFFT